MTRPSAPPLALEIERLAAGGDGVAHAADGRVVFVPFTAPGDRVEVRITEERPRFLRGEVVRLLAAGPARVAPVCEVFGRCGGCAWQHLAYPAQREAKAAILRDALVRLAGVAGLPELVVHASPAPLGYRTRARVLVRGGRVGFHRRRSHELCATARCPVLDPRLERALADLAARAAAGDGALREGEWQLAVGDEGGAQAVAPGAPPHAPPAVALETAAGRLEVSAGGFFQANAALRGAFAAAVVAAAGRGALAVELHAGAGFFTLALARCFERVVAVEADPRAAADLGRNLAAAGLANVAIRAEPVARALARGDLGGRPDAVVLDPPRTGLAPDELAALASLGAARIAYASCDPATLARDVARLVAAGHRLVSAEGFDLFPQTPHLEALVVLERA